MVSDFNMRGAGKRHDNILYTADFIASVFSAIVKFPKWKERIEYIKKMNPDQAYKIKEKNIRERSYKEGWVKQAMKAKEEAYQESLENAMVLTKDQTIQTLEQERTVVDKLNEQIERITEQLNDYSPASKEYDNLMKALDRCQSMLGKLSGTDRMRKQQEGSDRAKLNLATHREKLKINNELQANNPFLPEQQADVTIIGDDE